MIARHGTAARHMIDGTELDAWGASTESGRAPLASGMFAGFPTSGAEMP